MENPWSSPWTTDDDPSKKSASGPASPRLAFPPAVKLDVADPSSLWAQDDGFGVWSGGGAQASPGDVEAPERKSTEGTGDDELPSSAGLGAADVDSLPSPPVGAGPWATAVSSVAAEAPEKLAFAEESALKQNALGGATFADGPDTPTPTPPASPKIPMSAVHTGNTVTDGPSAPSPELVSPDASPGRGPDAVALSVLKHRDDTSPAHEGTRKVSKVRELVDMYDAIAKKASEPPSEPDPSEKPERARSIAADEDEEDWEEFESGADQKRSDRAPFTEPPAVLSELTFPEHPSKAVKFRIDEASFSILFDAQEEPPTPPADIPDRLDPLDTFTLTERRAWYRLSRQGSSRLHDVGDPDNYTRVAWQGSAVSAETFAIVRRWMQEGAVRTRAGGVRGSAATFGWEHSSSSDPVDLSFLRKRKSAEGRQRSESTTASFSKPALATGTANGVAAAGGRPLSVPTPPKGFNLASELPSTPAKPSPLVFTANQGCASRESDSDEEWGEMVTSPEVSGAFDTPTTPRADSAVSFGKSGSGSSLDSRPAGPKTPTASKLEIHGETKIESGHVRIASLSSPTPADVRMIARSGQASTPAEKRGDVQIEPEEMEVVRGVISHLPDLSYMLR
ncbi:hypothetical protein VUR80DRAFT_6755 [Thermomyces stellatus]